MGGPVIITITNNNLPLLEQLEPLMRARIVLAMRQIGLLLERGAVLAIQNQIAPDGSSWAQLAEWYVQWKVKKGYSDQIYTMSSTYIQAITSAVEGEAEGEDITVTVGVKRDGATNPKTGLEVYRIAEILEYGWEQFNVRIPPRPLWRPLLEVNRRSIETRVGQAIAGATKAIAEQAKVRPPDVESI